MQRVVVQQQGAVWQVQVPYRCSKSNQDVLAGLVTLWLLLGLLPPTYR